MFNQCSPKNCGSTETMPPGSRRGGLGAVALALCREQDAINAPPAAISVRRDRSMVVPETLERSKTLREPLSFILPYMTAVANGIQTDGNLPPP